MHLKEYLLRSLALALIAGTVLLLARFLDFAALPSVGNRFSALLSHIDSATTLAAVSVLAVDGIQLLVALFYAWAQSRTRDDLRDHSEDRQGSTFGRRGRIFSFIAAVIGVGVCYALLLRASEASGQLQRVLIYAGTFILAWEVLLLAAKVVRAELGLRENAGFPAILR